MIAQEPVEERLADRLHEAHVGPEPVRRGMENLLRRIGHLDRAVFSSVARLSTPLLDVPLQRVSNFANDSKPWIAVAACLAVGGRTRGRRAALRGITAVVVTSFVVNQPMKRASARRRPDREILGVPPQRWVRMPTSTSFPSGHSASAAAFAVGVSDVIPTLRLPLGGAASVVAFSRVYTGVHYPSDVLIGALVGALVGRAATMAGARARSILAARA